MARETPDPLDDLRRHLVPPPSLESRVVGALRDAGAFRATRAPNRRWRAIAAAAAFAVGVIAGRLTAPASFFPPSQGPAFMLLLGGDVTPSSDPVGRAREYGDWARAIAARGIVVRGSELEDGGRFVGGPDNRVDREPLLTAGGYFIVETASEEEATALAETCPHVKYGGSIAVRRLINR